MNTRAPHFRNLPNCNIFNDGAFSPLTDRETKLDNVLLLENGKPLIIWTSEIKRDSIGWQ